MDLFKILMKSWKLIVALFLITVVVVGTVSYYFIPKTYRSYTLFSLETEGRFGANFGQVDMVKDIIQSNQFLQDVLTSAGVSNGQGGVGELRSAITISQTAARNIKLEIIWGDPQKAYDILNKVYDCYKAHVAERINIYTINKLKVAEERFNRNKEVFERNNFLLADFQKRNGIIFPPDRLTISDQYYHDFKGQFAVSPESLTEYEKLIAEHAAAKENYTKAYGILDNTRRAVEIERNFLFVTIEPPVFPVQKHSPSTVMNTAVAGVLALFIGVILAFLRDYINNYQRREQAIDM